MRKIIICFMMLGAFIFTSCKDDLNPYGQGKEKYVLNCIIRADTNYQVLTLTKNYTITNLNPYSNTDDPAIQGALIRVWEGNDTVAIFKDTTITRDASSSYKTPFTIYHTRGFQPLSNSSIKIEAILPNGKKLSSSSTAPQYPSFSILGQGGVGDSAVPPPNSYVTFKWGTVAYPKGTVYLPRISVIYKKLENGVYTRKFKYIPVDYFTYAGTEYPEYPTLSNKPWLFIDTSVVNRSMREISAGDGNKSNYVIYGILIEVLSLDDNLTAYYNSTVKGKDPYSINLYETDYTNIDGGYGVFGIQIFSEAMINISYNYVTSFGYRHAYRTR